MIINDKEPAITPVVDTALTALKAKGVTTTNAEGSVPYDPQTNGAA